MRTWFVTGASRGFGALIVKHALANGDTVVATARNPEVITRQFGPRTDLLAQALDVTDEAQAHRAAKEATTAFGRIDVLVNNAGYGLLGAVEEATAEEIEAVYRTNVFGLLPVTRAVLPQGSSRGSATDGSHPPNRSLCSQRRIEPNNDLCGRLSPFIVVFSLGWSWFA